jgi:pyridoxine kinase
MVIVDPVMGDGGQLYNGIGKRQVELMRQMVSVAHLTIPNYTEACYLTNTQYKQGGMTQQEACDLLDRLTAIGARSAVITSCIIEGHHQVCGYDHTNESNFFLEYQEIPGQFHGTGDIFSAVLIGHLMKGEPLKQSTRRAMDVVHDMIFRNRDVKDHCCGIFIERCLDLL